MMTSEIKIYNCGYIGAFESSRRNVSAYNSKEAKQYFAAVFGGSVSYVVARHHDVVSLNDHRHCIDWYDAECGREVQPNKNTGRASLVSAGIIKPGEIIS
jgi:hypothetical protein